MSHRPRPTAVLEQSQARQIGGLAAGVKAIIECIDWGGVCVCVCVFECAFVESHQQRFQDCRAAEAAGLLELHDNSVAVPILDDERVDEIQANLEVDEGKGSTRVQAEGVGQSLGGQQGKERVRALWRHAEGKDRFGSSDWEEPLPA